MLRFAWNDLFNNLVQIGLTVSVVALLLFLLRKTLKKRYPARVMCMVWAVLALRFSPVRIFKQSGNSKLDHETYLRLCRAVDEMLPERKE